MTFDVIVGNPPFKGRGALYLQILDAIKEITNKIVYVLPATWLVDEREKHNRYVDIRKSLNGKLKEAVLFNGNHVFGIKSFVPIAIIVVDMNAKNSQLVITDMLRGGEVDAYDDIFNVTLFGNCEKRLIYQMKNGSL